MYTHTVLQVHTHTHRESAACIHTHRECCRYTHTQSVAGTHTHTIKNTHLRCKVFIINGNNYIYWLVLVVFSASFYEVMILTRMLYLPIFYIPVLRVSSISISGWMLSGHVSSQLLLSVRLGTRVLHQAKGLHELVDVDAAVLVEIDALGQIRDGFIADVRLQVRAQQLPRLTKLLKRDQT